MTGCAASAGLALFACLARDPACLPVDRRPLLPVLEAMGWQESGHRDWALRDETTGESLFFRTGAEAVAAARSRRARGHLLGYGRFQITGDANLARHGLTPETAFLPCPNLRAAAEHLAAGIRRYNGSGPAAERYARQVVARVPDRPAVAPPSPASACGPAPPAWDGLRSARHRACLDREARP